MTRSALFLPASNPRAIQKARTLDCDVVILDLEDAVAEEQKEEARDAAVDALIYGGFGPRVGVRINGLDTPWGRDDLDACRQAGVDLVVVPKVETADYLNGIGALVQGGPSVWAMIETPLALLNLRDIAAAGLGGLEALMLGVNDLAATLRTGPSPDREPLKPWLAATVAAARAHGLLAIDGVYNAFTDAEGFAAECAQGRLYGFDGKSLIHPSQIEAANAAFSPSEAEVAWARAVVAAFSTPEADGRGAISIDGQMVERLHLSEAQRTLANLSRKGP
jgi:citrate lyase subunit beta/citryl-CoA lyase